MRKPLNRYNVVIRNFPSSGVMIPFERQLKFFTPTHMTSICFFFSLFLDGLVLTHRRNERNSIIMWTNPQKCYRIRCVTIVMIYLHKRWCFAFWLKLPHIIHTLCLCRTILFASENILLLLLLFCDAILLCMCIIFTF